MRGERKKNVIKIQGKIFKEIKKQKEQQRRDNAFNTSCMKSFPAGNKIEKFKERKNCIFCQEDKFCIFSVNYFGS